MAGPYQPRRGTDPLAGPSQPLPYPQPYPAAPSVPSYPGALPPPIPYPKRRRGPLIAGAAVVLLVIAAVVAVVVFGVRNNNATPAGVLTAASAQQAIQKYLDALADGDVQTISRNTLCGLYDGVKDRRTDDALARLASDAFSKQFSRAEVTSVDTMAFASPNSAQALFSMRVTPAPGARESTDERQAVAQLLAYDNEILVCSYVQRTAGTF
jgi:hypothetical protein